MVKNNQDNDFNDNQLTNLDSVSVNRNPGSENEVTNKKYVDVSIEEGNFLRFNQTSENYLKVSVGNDSYNLTKYDKTQLIDTTIIKQGNGQYLLPRWKVICNDKNNNVVTNFTRATKTNSRTSHSGATSLPSIGSAFMYIETSSNNQGHERVFISCERTDIIQISNIKFYYNRFSIKLIKI